MSKKGPVVVMRVFVCWKHRILAVRRSRDSRTDPDRWEILGGKIEPGYTLIENLNREAYEEAGVKVAMVDHRFHTFSDTLTSGPYKDRTRIVLTGIGRLIGTGAEVRLSEEHSAYEWVTYPEFMALDLRKEVREAGRAMRTRILHLTR